MSTFIDELLTHVGALRRNALRLTRNLPDAEDLVQDSLVLAIQFQHRFETGTSMQSWLFVVMRNHFIAGIRYNRRRPSEQLDSRHQIVEHVSDFGSRIEEHLFLGNILTVVDSLPAPMKEALHTIGLGHSYDEAAQMAGVPIGTIKSRVSIGRRRLQECRA